VGHLAVGATAKFRRGILAGRVSDNGTFVQNEPNFDAPAAYNAVYFNPDSSLNNGSGFGLDLGAAYDFASGVRIAASVENLVSTMSWKDENLLYATADYRLQQSADGFTYSDTKIIDTTVAYDPTDATQKALRDSLLSIDPFATKLRLGAQLSVGPVRLAGDAAFELTDGIVPGASKRVSVGAELPISVVRLRGGLATMFDGGVAFSGGLGFKMGPVRLDFAAGTTPGGDRQGLTFATGLSVVH